MVAENLSVAVVDLDGNDRAPDPRGLTPELVPPDAAEPYLACLNACFGGGWDRRAYEWYLRRPFAGREPDVLVLADDGRWVTGMGLNYRRLALAGGDPAAAAIITVDAAIITAAWTLPEARGRGQFQRLIRAGMTRARERGCALLLGFVTHDNPSNRAMTKSGAVNVPAWYLTDGPRQPEAPQAVRPAPPDAVERLRAWRPGRPAVRFEYARDDDWRAQLLARPHPAEVLAVGDAGLAVIERVDDTDRLQLLAAGDEERPGALAALAARARRGGRRFFAYSTRPETPAEAGRHGLAVTSGYVTVIDLRGGGEHPAGGAWDVQSGDRM